MFKRLLIGSLLSTAFAVPAMAEVSISGSAEMDLFVRTNQTASESTDLGQEIAIVINVDGKDKLDNGDTLKWRLAQKVATDYRYDAWGQREAWIGYQGGWGELRFGTQFTNSYLMLDWPYGSKGQNNMTGDLGAQTETWKDAISYFSPDFNGVNFSAQYKIGSKNAAQDTNTQAYDIGLNGKFGAVAVNAGYQRHNDALVGVYPVGVNGVEEADRVGSGYKTEMYFVGATGTFGDFSTKALYKNNKWSTNVDSTEANQWLVGATYTMGKNAFSLGYQELMDSKTNGQKNNDSVDQISFQWDYAMSKNTGAFLQARHHMYGSNDQKFKLDGSEGVDNNVSNTTRVLVGTYTSF